MSDLETRSDVEVGCQLTGNNLSDHYFHNFFFIISPLPLLFPPIQNFLFTSLIEWNQIKNIFFENYSEHLILIILILIIYGWIPFQAPSAIFGFFSWFRVAKFFRCVSDSLGGTGGCIYLYAT